MIDQNIVCAGSASLKSPFSDKFIVNMNNDKKTNLLLPNLIFAEPVIARPSLLLIFKQMVNSRANRTLHIHASFCILCVGELCLARQTTVTAIGNSWYDFSTVQGYYCIATLKVLLSAHNIQNRLGKAC